MVDAEPSHRSPIFRDGLMGPEEVDAYRNYVQSLGIGIDVDAAVAALDRKGLTQAGMATKGFVLNDEQKTRTE